MGDEWSRGKVPPRMKAVLRKAEEKNRNSSEREHLVPSVHESTRKHRVKIRVYPSNRQLKAEEKPVLTHKARRAARKLFAKKPHYGRPQAK